MNDLSHGVSLVVSVNAGLTVASYLLTKFKDKIEGKWDDRILSVVNVLKEITDILSGSWRRGF